MNDTPPPPPSGSGWPAAGGQPPQSPPSQPPQSQPPQSQPPSQAVGGGREKWWSTGRVIGAIVIVLVLMGGSATAGFFAGAAWSGVETIGQGIADDFNEGLQDGFDEGFGGTDGPTDQGSALQVGDTVTGMLSEDSTAEHELTVTAASQVTVELRSDDFDTTVTVIDQAGNELAYNDDIEFGEDRNSRVQVDLDPGTYTVVVDAFGFGEGNYELAVR